MTWLSWTMTVPESCCMHCSNEDHLRDCEQVATRFRLEISAGSWVPDGLTWRLRQGSGGHTEGRCQRLEFQESMSGCRRRQGLKELLETQLERLGDRTCRWGEAESGIGFWVLGLDSWLGGGAADYIRELGNKNRFREKGWSVWSHTWWVWGFCKRWHLWSVKMFRSEDRVSSQ